MTTNLNATQQRRRWEPLLLLLGLVIALLLRFPALTGTETVTAANPALFNSHTGETYLSDPDCYLFLRQARLLIEGVRDNRDMLSKGIISQVDIYPQKAAAGLLAVFQHIVGIFSNLSLSTTAAILDTVLSLSAMLPVFFYVRRRTNAAGAFFGALYIAVCLPFAVRSMGASYDTDSFMAFLPLTFFASVLRMTQSIEKRQRYAWLAVSWLSSAIMLCWWQTSYIYIAFALALCVLCLAAVKLYERRSHGRSAIKRLLLLWASGIVLIYLLIERPSATLKNFAELWNLIIGIGTSNSYPSCLLFVSEMKKVPFFELGFKAGTGSVMSYMGSLPIWIMALISLIIISISVFRSLRSKADDVPEKLTELCLLLGWFAFGLVLSAFGIRFTQFPVLPLALLLGLGVGKLLDYLRRRIPSPALSTASRALLCLLCLAFLIPSGMELYSTAIESVPFVTTLTEELCTQIKERTEANTGLISWWDNGYYYQYAADRRSVTDGGRQSGAVDYYIARALLSSDPKLSAGICRMLNYGELSAPELLDKWTGDSARSSDILLDILPLSRAEAEKRLTAKWKIPYDETQELLKLTHPDAYPTALVISSDMLYKIPVIAYYGGYDLHTGESGGGEFYFSKAACGFTYGEAVKLDLGLDDTEAAVQAIISDSSCKAIAQVKGAPVFIERIAVVENGHIISDTDSGYGAYTLLLFVEDNNVSAALMTSYLMDSVMLRLFLLSGEGLEEDFELLWQGSADSAEPIEQQRRTRVIKSAALGAQLWKVY